MWRCVVTVILACLAACARPPRDGDRDREIARVHAHLARAEAELAAHPPAALTAAQQRARAGVLADLHAYTEAERYPTNDLVADATPIFIDEYGARCAMAALIERGDRALVARVARDHVYAHIADLAGDADLARWLVAHGVTLAEAAAIQPSYANYATSRWAPTLSAVTSADAGIATGGGATDFYLWLAAGLRVGARRIVETEGSCDHCVFRSDAFVAEYQRSDALGAGATNQVGAYWQHDLTVQARDHQFYTVVGPLALLDSESALGARVAVGASLQRRAWPVFAELALSELTSAHTETVRAGVSAGFVW